MYGSKLNNILNDIEDKNIEIAGGAIVGMVMSITNSLIIYISNLTIGKKNYEEVYKEVQELKEKAQILKEKSLSIVDKDKEVLEEILEGYKLRKEHKDKYQEICKKSVELCLESLNIAYETYKLSELISIIGNKNLKSDFQILKYYSYASIKSAIVNIDINLKELDDTEYINNVKEKYENILKIIDKE